MKDVFEKLVGLLIVGIGFVGFMAVLCFFYGFLVMLLWNWLMPELFGLKAITWLQGFGISFLSGLLFKSQQSSSKSN